MAALAEFLDLAKTGQIALNVYEGKIVSFEIRERMAVVSDIRSEVLERVFRQRVASS